MFQIFLFLLSVMSRSGEFRISDFDACINYDSSDGEVPPSPPRIYTPKPLTGATLRIEDGTISKVNLGKVVMSEAKIKALAASRAAEAKIKALEVDIENKFGAAALEVSSPDKLSLSKVGTMTKEVNTTSFGKIFHESLETLFKVLRPFTEVSRDERQKEPTIASYDKQKQMVEEIRKNSEMEITHLLTSILLDRNLKFKNGTKSKKVDSSELITADKSSEVKLPEITSKETLSTSALAIPLTCICSAMHDLIMSCPVGGGKHDVLCATKSKRGGHKRRHSESPAPIEKTAKPKSEEPSGQARGKTLDKGRSQTHGKKHVEKEVSNFTQSSKRGRLNSTSENSHSYTQVVKENSRLSKLCPHDEVKKEWSGKEIDKSGWRRKEFSSSAKLKETQRKQDLGLVPLVQSQQLSATITSYCSPNNIPGKNQVKKLMSNAGLDSASSISFPSPSGFLRIPKFPKRSKHGDKAVDSNGNVMWSQMPLKPASLPANVTFEVTVEGGFWCVKYVQ